MYELRIITTTWQTFTNISTWSFWSNEECCSRSKQPQDFHQISVTSGIFSLLPKTQSLLKLQHLAFAKLSILLDRVNGGPNAKLTPFEYCNLPVFDHLPIASLQRSIAVGREVFLLCLGSSLWFDRLNPNKRHPKSQSFQSRFWWRSAC